MLAALIPIAAVTPAAATTGELVITGVIDGPLSGGIPKAVELYVASDIADLSIYGVGSANNGGGTDGEEFTFPADAATAGDFIYVASESPGFESFFGFAPNYTSSAMSINGDDAVELFENGSVVDVFGDIGTDGTGEPWEHLDGWAYRVDGTGRDGSAFVLANWTFSGPDALDGETTNATAAKPFPIGTYTEVYTPPPPVVVINEIIQNPDAVGDSYGEWFELFNPTAAPIDIDGWTIADDDFDSHVIANGGPLEIPAGGYVVLARDGDVTLNGGVVADYVYGSAWSLSNAADEVVLLDGSLVEVDRVNYDNGLTFPDPNGASMALSDPALDNNDGANWCESGSPFGAGDFGSPGAANDCAPPPLACSTADGDLTLISEIQGDGFESPLHGQQVTIRGVVTLADTDLDGYFIQEEVGDSDGNPATSEGLFVYDTRPLPLEGETVELTDYVTDFYGLTQFAFPDMEICDVPIDYLEPTPISF
ncbi:MAG: lamin tail domain-containing protein, partial [Actinomycetota bacterium]